MSILVVPVNGAKPIRKATKVAHFRQTDNNGWGSITIKFSVSIDFSVPAPSADEKIGIIMALHEDGGRRGFRGFLHVLIKDIPKDQLTKTPRPMNGKTDLGKGIVFPQPLIETDRKLIIKDSSGDSVIGSIYVEGESKLEWDSPEQLKRIHLLREKMVSSGWRVKERDKRPPRSRNKEDYFKHFILNGWSLEKELKRRKFKSRTQVLSFLEKFVIQAMVNSEDVDWREFFPSVHAAYSAFEDRYEYKIIEEKVLDWWKEGNE